MTRLVTIAHDLVASAIDLTRACAETEFYLAWLITHSQGSAFVADHLCRAALAFHMQPAAQTIPFDAYVARETFADTLMASAPLSNRELASAARNSIPDAASLRTAALPQPHARTSHASKS